MRRWLRTTRSGRSNGSSRSIPPWSGPTSMPRGPEKRGCSAAVEAIAVAGEHLGRSRGGLSSTIHLAVDGRGLPMSVVLTAGQAGDNPHLVPLLDQIRVRRAGAGRPRSRPEAVIADKAYSHPTTRQALRRRAVSDSSWASAWNTARTRDAGR